MLRLSTRSAPKRFGARPRQTAASTARRSTSPTASSISRPPTRPAKRRQSISPGRTELLLVAVDARRARRRAEIRGVARRRAVSASLRAARARRREWVKPLPLGADGAHLSRRWRPNERARADRPEGAVRFDPETAHGLSIAALKSGLPLAPGTLRDDGLQVTVAGLDFPNPLGMAAGYDKNAEVPDALLGLGFGFAEVGTRDAAAAGGNPKPRIFRLTADHAVINRLGFNNEGHEARRKAPCRAQGARRHRRRQHRRQQGQRRPYRRLCSAACPVRAIRQPISPSTSRRPTRRACATCRRASAGELLRASWPRATRPPAKPPVFLKIAPDLVEAELEDIAAEVTEKQDRRRHRLQHNAVARRINGAAPSRGERWAFRAAAVCPLDGGSGANAQTGRQGIGADWSGRRRFRPRTALEKIRAGADLVPELYTGLVYGGPGLPGRIRAGLAARCAEVGVTSIGALRDAGVAEWAAR